MKNGKTLKEGVLHECPVEEEKGFEKKLFLRKFSFKATLAKDVGTDAIKRVESGGSSFISNRGREGIGTTC
ncbi:hypothetical protein HYC85_015375 [Camellia sinensis]|uniref:Uncharacterized protein n=1 Tax=Camellia sinensis TaxID=4442 RepID=A0A7J7GXI2_CAMSI|nr:hypothetical protein HYC85_015375 [Camellia sinensis]